jgi:amino acid permease
MDKYRGIVTGKTVQNIFSSTKVIVLVGFIILGIVISKNAVCMGDKQRNLLESFGNWTNNQVIP